ncbi:MAG TPA: Gfo/Idh/MocA family oxidoreductase, partial [Agriterribacter sp.]|nr:Gfo/Idh/MocA family oxidoreductase [Agriterribacter sp.]
MEKKTIKAGFLGTGFAARFHFDAVLRLSGAGVEAVGAFSRTKEKLLEFTQARHIKAYDSAEALINDCDVIHITTPPITHEPFIVAALKQNKYV